MVNDMHREFVILLLLPPIFGSNAGWPLAGSKHTHVCISPLLFFSIVKSIHTQGTFPYPLTVSLISFLVTL